MMVGTDRRAVRNAMAQRTSVETFVAARPAVAPYQGRLAPQIAARSRSASFSAEYMYGGPVTTGVFMKLCFGGGEGVCHSKPVARHGFGPAARPRLIDQIK